MVIVVTAFFVWPGVLLPGCRSLSGPTESINGRTYCFATVPVPNYSTHWSANYTEWGYTFQLWAPLTPGLHGVRINVTEPSGTEYSGGMTTGGPPRTNYTSTWFSPDNMSGVSVVWNTFNASLLVEQ